MKFYIASGILIDELTPVLGSIYLLNVAELLVHVIKTSFLLLLSREIFVQIRNYKEIFFVGVFVDRYLNFKIWK